MSAMKPIAMWHCSKPIRDGGHGVSLRPMCENCHKTPPPPPLWSRLGESGDGSAAVVVVGLEDL